MIPNLLRSRTGGGGLALSLILLVGCSQGNGVADLDADEILERMQSAVADSTSVRVVGAGVRGDSSVSVDLQLDSAGNATGHLDTNGQRVEIVSVDGSVYISAGDAFWTDQVGATFAGQLAGKFVRVPEGEPTLADLVDYDVFLENLLAPEGATEKGDETTVDDSPVVELIDAADDGRLFVALEGEPLPQKVVPSEGGELLLSDWNSPVSVETPAPDEIFEPSTGIPAP